MKKIWIAMIMVSFVCLVGCTKKDNTTIDENKVSPEQSFTVSQNSEKQEVKNEDNISDSQEAKDNEETKNTEEVKVQPSPIITNIIGKSVEEAIERIYLTNEKQKKGTNHRHKTIKKLRISY